MESPTSPSEGFIFSKEIFLSLRKDDIQQYYEMDSKVLGKGAFGTVYKGRLIGSEGPWRAIKKIPRKVVTDVQMLMNEIEYMISLDHPLVIKLYDIFEWKGAVYLVTDLFEGGQLFDKLEEEGSFSEQTARTIFRQMVEAINYLHHQNLAHRDLKPENFLFLNSDSLDLKVIDFGLSYRWEQDMKLELQKAGDKKLVGTSYYLAPEVIEHSYDQRCDIWSLGVILYMLVSATPPFDGDNDREIMQNVKKINYTFQIPEFDEISSQLKDLLQKILLPDDERITIAEILKHPWMEAEVSKQPLKINFHRMAEFSKYSKLKKVTATYIASQCSEQQVQKLGELFRQIDKDKNGTIEIQELKEALSELQDEKTLASLKEIMESIDTDQNGTINYTEFLSCAIEKEKLFTEENLRKMFEKLDTDGNGTVEKQELIGLLEENEVDEAHINEIMSSVDADGDGKITFEEFKNNMLLN